MFDKKFIRQAIDRSAENALDRRRFLQAAGAAGLGVAGAAAIGGGVATAQTQPDGGPSDSAILNFALNLEYLEGEFYARAVTGAGLPDSIIGGTGTPGGVTGGRKVPFRSRNVRLYAEEINADEQSHVRFLRNALGSAAVSRPAIDLDRAFSAAAVASGLIRPGQRFDVFANEQNFLLGAFIFEDVGVTAYKGAARFIDSRDVLEAAAGILAVEAYHAGIIRSTLFTMGIQTPPQRISDARDSVDGPTNLDIGLSPGDLVPADGFALAFSRSPAQVLNVVYLNPAQVTSGGFFPNGVNGEVRQSDRNA